MNYYLGVISRGDRHEPEPLDTEFECYGCGEKVLHNPMKDFVPTDWRIIKLHGVAQQFCHRCKWGFEYGQGTEHPSQIYPRMRDQLARRHGLKLD